MPNLPPTARAEMTTRGKNGFWRRVQKDGPGGCWIWTGVVNHNGYGRYTYQRLDGRGLAGRAHRIAYELEVGRIPEGLQLDHLCRVRHCVNPAHLEPVTSAENNRRSSRFRGGSIEQRPNSWRVVWRVEGRKQSRSFQTEAEAAAFLAGREAALQETAA